MSLHAPASLWTPLRRFGRNRKASAAVEFALALSDLGLEGVLRRHVEGWSRDTGIVADAETTTLGPGRFSFVIETTVYRVVQEA